MWITYVNYPRLRSNSLNYDEQQELAFEPGLEILGYSDFYVTYQASLLICICVSTNTVQLQISPKHESFI